MKTNYKEVEISVNILNSMHVFIKSEKIIMGITSRKIINIQRIALYSAILLASIATSIDAKSQDKTHLSSDNISTTADHESEGFTVHLNDKNIAHIYRLDPGKKGDHVSNGGKIAMIVSRDNGRKWSKPRVIYDSRYDDRNIRGGRTREGEIIVFFRRYNSPNKNAANHHTVDLNYIISNDEGKTWSKRQVVPKMTEKKVQELWLGNFIESKPKLYMAPLAGISYCKLVYFTIGKDKRIKWENNDGYTWDFLDEKKPGIDEPYIAKVGKKRYIALFRDDIEKKNYFQSTSIDDGKNWSKPMRTNLISPYFAPSPAIFFHEENNDLIAIGTDRRLAGQGSAKLSGIHIYKTNLNKVLDDPTSHKLYTKIPRANPSHYVFYGYPSILKTNENDLLIIYTESSHDGANEDADLVGMRLPLTSKKRQ